MGDLANNKPDSIRKNFDSIQFNLIQFTGCGIVARGQVMVLGAVANPIILIVDKLSKIFSSENVHPKMPNLGLITFILGKFWKKKLNVEHDNLF